MNKSDAHSNTSIFTAMHYTIIQALQRAFLDRELERYKTNANSSSTWKWIMESNGLERVDKDLLYRALVIVVEAPRERVDQISRDCTLEEVDELMNCIRSDHTFEDLDKHTPADMQTTTGSTIAWLMHRCYAAENEVQRLKDEKNPLFDNAERSIVSRCSPCRDALYEEFREIIDGGSESMTHEDAIKELLRLSTSAMTQFEKEGQF